MASYTIALAGNPNCGKTTLFNALTGSRQRVGNWPGVTVEHIEGTYRQDEDKVTVVDLPGIYSFSAYSVDESISREYILQRKPAVVVNIVDATNLERNLYLTTQLLEMKAPTVVALNMMDVARHRHIRIEVEHLARHLDCPVVPMVASRGEGVDELRQAIERVAHEKHVSSTKVAYDEIVEEAIAAIEETVSDVAGEQEVDSRWLAVKLLEGDELAESMAAEQTGDILGEQHQRIERHTGDDADIIIADGRYGFIHGLVRDVLHRDLQVRKTVSDAIDRVVLNRLLGIPLFLLVMYGVFALTIHVGGPFIDFFDRLTGLLFVDGLRVLLEGWGSPELLTSILADGIGGGIQTVSTFIPPIFFIFLCLSILEDSGYMARAAFVMDRLMRAIGLPGKAFLPMLVGFGCNVPAILATRTLENRRDRIMTVLMNPFMSCGARLPVYTLFAVAFFREHGPLIIFGIYLAGILLGVLTGVLLKHTLLRGEASTFVMELPPYHIPTVSGIAHHTWNKLKGFILRAGRVILLVVVIMSVLSSISVKGRIVTDPQQENLLSAIGRGVSPALKPMGIFEDNYPAAVGLFTGIFAKEAIVGTLDTLYARMEVRQRGEVESPPDGGGTKPSLDLWAGLGEAVRAIPEGFGVLQEPISEFRSLGDAEESSTGLEVRRHFRSRASAIAYLLFVLIYAPCVAAIAAIYRETNGRWALFSVGYLTMLAWIVATCWYQAATLPAHPASSLSWLGGCLLFLAGFVFVLRRIGRRIQWTV